MYNKYSKINIIGVKCPNSECSFAFTVKIGDANLHDITCPICNLGKMDLSYIRDVIMQYNDAVDLMNKTIDHSPVTIIE